MRIFLSVDMEGVAGVMDAAHWEMTGQFYDRACALMTAEANAAIEGLLEAGATEILVNDSHHRMINLDPVALHPAAKLIQGRIKPMSMCQGLGPGFDAALFVGYHAGRGTARGCLDHTYTGILHDVRINGRQANEAALNGLVAGHFGCPLVLVTGDPALREEMRAWNPQIHACVVKECFGRQAVMSLHPAKSRELIRGAAKRAALDRAQIAPLRVEPPVTLDIELVNTQMADFCERIVGVERTGGRSVRAQAGDMLTVFRYFLTIMSMAGTVS
ncbi:MAG: M55 family metallopeptidase [Candidatus Sumerlaeia bacterium]|nr:M55 family metallopeptidase [Candidatus Sumerlaeia bacterium]